MKLPKQGVYDMRIAIIALSALTMAAAVPASASTDLVIQYDDLDLSSPKGQKVLERRIDTVARKYCGVGSTMTGTRMKSPGATECLNSARDAAREQMAVLVKRQSTLNGG
jgi:UrcA family protein